jgi:two-component system, NarL family, nitrate/nitrite response regulator NarL
VRSVCVYVVSDVRLYREGLTGSLAADGRLSIIGSGAAAGALEQISTLRPDVMLLDLAAQDSLCLPRSVMAVAPNLQVVAFAVADVAADVLACAEAGICGYVPKDASIDDVVDAVLRAVSGELVCSPRIAAKLFQRIAALATERSAVPELLALTRRELEIAMLMTRGLPNKEIARELRRGPATIKNHVHNILQKLKLKRRGEIGGLRLNTAVRPGEPAGDTMRHTRPY